MNYFSLAPFPFYSYTISMLSFRTGLPQYPQSLHKAQNSRKALDRAMMGITITQQLSNSATQQLSNSGVKSVCALKNGQLFSH